VLNNILDMVSITEASLPAMNAVTRLTTVSCGSVVEVSFPARKSPALLDLRASKGYTHVLCTIATSSTTARTQIAALASNNTGDCSLLSLIFFTHELFLPRSTWLAFYRTTGIV
jgi:hypothetical protein